MHATSSVARIGGGAAAGAAGGRSALKRVGEVESWG
jgi:hypothetical protein